MAAISAGSLREKTSQELVDQMRLEKKRMFDAIVKGASGEAIKPHEKREGKRLIARIRSILRERELRQALDKQIVALQAKAKDASPSVAKLVRRVDERVAEIKTELGKPAGKRKDKPFPARIRPRHAELRRVTDGATREAETADRAAVGLAEAKRLRAALEREDVGQGR